MKLAEIATILLAISAIVAVVNKEPTVGIVWAILAVAFRPGRTA